MRFVLGLAAVLLAVSGVALLISLSDGGESASAPSSTTSLTVHYWPRGQSQPGGRIWTLYCRPASGSLPNAKGACAFLTSPAARTMFANAPSGQLCTMIYGGPEEAQIDGLLNGRPLHLHVARSDGCGIARWLKLSPLLPVLSR